MQKAKALTITTETQSENFAILVDGKMIAMSRSNLNVSKNDVG
jgi:hypothetical protein